MKPSSEGKFLSNGKANYQTKHLVFCRDAIAVRYTWTTYSLLAIFALLFVFPFTFFLNTGFQFGLLPILIFCGLAELIIFSCFIYCLFNTRNLPVFDTLNGKFYPQGRSHAESAVSTKDINHLQILETEMSPGFCYELNAVMKNGNRLNIMAHGGRQNFMKDAKQLAENLALSIKDEQGEPYVDIPGKHEGPLVPGGVSFQSMRLVFRQDSITVKATWRLHLGYILFMAIGTGIFCMGLFSSDGLFWPALIMGALFAGIALLGSLTMILKKTFPLFDMVDGMFYPKGFTRDGSGISLKQLDHLEILKERVYNKNGSYDSYELNVALKDGSRYNIMDHGADKLLLADAKQLAEKLSLPLINADTAQPITHEEIKLHKELSAPMTAGGAVFLIIFGLMFFGAGSLAAWMVCLKPMSGVIASGNWTPTPARIVSSHLDSSRGSRGGSTYRVNIHYEYDVNGAHYTSNRYDFFRSDMSSNVGVGTMREIVNDLPQGAETTCLVNPSNPDEAVISRKIPWFNLLFMLFPLPFLCIGLFTILTVIRTLCAQKVQSDLLKQMSKEGE